MSTLKTHNLQSPDAGSVNIAMTQNAGMVVAGVSTFTGNIDANGDLDVDGHTNLDNTSIVGIVTISAGTNNEGLRITGQHNNAVIFTSPSINGSAGYRLNHHPSTNFLRVDTTDQNGAFTGTVAKFSSAGLDMSDNIKLRLGTNQDLTLYHYGNDAYIDNADGDIIFRQVTSEKLRIESSGDIIFKNNGGDNRIERDTTSGGPYLLFHNRGTGTTDSSGVYNLGGISAAGYRDVSNPSIVGSIQFERQPTAGGASSGCNIVFRTGFNGTTSHTHHSEKLRLTYEGHLLPGANNQYDLGSTAKGWRNVYMNDLNLSNMKGDTNDVDGTQGSWTIQEGKDDLYIINRLNGKKFKIKMEEIS